LGIDFIQLIIFLFPVHALVYRPSRCGSGTAPPQAAGPDFFEKTVVIKNYFIQRQTPQRD
jgi:hypothetical protein